MIVLIMGYDYEKPLPKCSVNIRGSNSFRNSFCLARFSLSVSLLIMAANESKSESKQDNFRLVRNKSWIAEALTKWHYYEILTVQVNLFQKLAKSAEHVVYQNCFEFQNKTKTTICVHNIFCRYSELTIFMNNEPSVVILWVSWCKNKSFWLRFTCNTYHFQKFSFFEHIAIF